MLYKENFREAIRRQRSFFKGEMNDQILVTIEVPQKDLIHPCHLVYEGTDVDELVSLWEKSFETRSKIEDDYLPIAQADFGTGVTGGFFGANVRFECPDHNYGTARSSWSDPTLTDYQDLEKLRLDKNNPWVQKVTTATRYLTEKGKDKFFTAIMETAGPLDFATALRGPNVNLDFYLHPKQLHQLLDFAVDFTIEFIEMQRKYVDSFENGVFEAWGFWMPGNSLFVGEHAFGLCRPEFYEEWGIPHTQRLINHFGGAWVQLHTYALHLVSGVARLKKVFALQITDDPNTGIGGFDVLNKIKEQTNGLPLLICCTKEELLTGIKHRSLPGGVWYYLWSNDVVSISEANEIMMKVKQYQAKEM